MTTDRTNEKVTTCYQSVSFRKKTKKSQEEEEDEIEEEEPEPPEKRRFDEEKTRAQILKVMKESLAPPSERSVNISLGTSGTNSNHPQWGSLV